MRKDKEFIDATKGQTCEFEYKGRKCPSKKIVGIARGRFLCRVHFKTVTNDNNRRSRTEKPIPEDLTFTRDLTISETWSRLKNKMKGGKYGN